MRPALHRLLRHPRAPGPAWLRFRTLGLLWILAGLPAPGACADWTGTWQTRWRGGGAVLHLEQSGTGVSGTYSLYDGTVTGIADGRRLTGTWSESSGRQGEFTFTLSRDERTFAGRFANGEWWNGVRVEDPKSGPEPADRTSPRAALATFLRASNADRAGFLEPLQSALSVVDFTGPGMAPEREPDGSLLPQRRIDYVRQLFTVLDRTTVRLWEIPGPGRPVDDEATRVSVTLFQDGTAEEFPLAFVRRDAAWQIDPPPVSELESARKRLQVRNGTSTRSTESHLQLTNPRDTVRTFLEEMRRFESVGRPHVLRTLDLDGYPPNIRDAEAALMAHYLRHVLDRIGTAVYQEIPDDPGRTEEYICFAHGAGNIVIAPFALPDGGREWRFNHETLRSLRTLYAAMEDLPPLPGGVRPEDEPVYFRLRDVLRSSAPALLRRIGPIEGWQWLAVAVLFLTSLVLALILTALLDRVLGKPASATHAGGSHNRSLSFTWPTRGTLVGALWYLKIGTLGLPDHLAGPLRSLSATLAIGSGAWLAYRGAGVLAAHSRQTIGATGRRAILSSLGFGLTRIGLILGAALLLAAAWSLPYSSVLAGLGIGGLAVALAAQHTIQNMIAGFTLFADSPLSVGDFCRYGDKLGTVEEIGLRSTRIRSLDRTVISIPNSVFADMQLENFTRRDRMLFRTILGLRYETRPDQLRHVLAGLRELLLAHPRVTPEPSRVRLVGFGKSSLDLEIFAYVDASDWDDFLKVQEDILLRVIDLIEASGSGLAFPSQTLYVGRDPGLDRERAAAAEEQVRQWRATGQLPFPDFDVTFRREHRDTLDYPPRGSVAHRPETPADGTA